MKVMVNKISLVLLALIIVHSSDGFCKNAPVQKMQNKLVFLENKGQLKDQYGHARTDIQYSLNTPGMTVFIGDGQLHFQFNHTAANDAARNKYSLSAPVNTDVYRLDLSLAGANYTGNIISEDKQQYHETYYTNGDNKNGIEAKAYGKITYKDVYPGIDWVLYLKNNKLEYEFVIAPGADPSLIKLQYNGQQSLTLNDKGTITATTPMGIIKDNAPLCYYVDKDQKKSSIGSHFTLAGNTLSFTVENKATANNYSNKKLVIDPILEWGTYYGPDSSNSYFYDVLADKSEAVYACGLTYAATEIATSGAFQTTLGTGGSTDAFLVKFDSSGNRVWATYYGGTGGDWGAALAEDAYGYVYMAGMSNSTTGIATPGCDQSFFGGGMWAGFLVKFDTAGNRIWGTYVGGSIGGSFDMEISSVSCDSLGHVYVSGTTDDTSNVATVGSFKSRKLEGADTAIECFLLQYDTAGAKQWGTYYGGPGRNYALVGVNCNDGNNVYLAGYTNDTSASAFATPGSYQPSLHGSSNAFLAKFNSTGSRVWGTYYGGESSDALSGIAYSNAAVYLYGITYSDTGIASPGCYQPLRAGSSDAYLAQFSVELGFRVWGTYIGGPGDESSPYGRIAVDDSANVYVTGYTNSTTGMATPGAWQTTFEGGSSDAFLAKYNSAGIQQWSTYYGGTGGDQGYACSFAGQSVYICGQTNSPDHIATPGSFLSTSPGGTFYYQGFLGKFINPPSSSLSVKANTVDADVKLYPSPNNGLFTISVNTTDIQSNTASVTISDVAGREIVNEHLPLTNGSCAKQLDITNEPAGTYLLTLNINGQVSVRKFVKK